MKSIGTCCVLLTCVSAASSLVRAAQIVAIDFAQGGARFPLITTTSLGQPNVFEYDFVGPSSPFAAQGALAGWSNQQLHGAIVDSVRRVFRSAEIGQPGYMLNVDIRLGGIPPELGTRHLVGNVSPEQIWLGSAEWNGAFTRPDLNPADPKYFLYDGLNVTSATAVNTLAATGLAYTSPEHVINALTGTIAQEIAHTLGVAFDVPAGPYNGVYPIMASGVTGLPLEARRTARQFLDIPNTQPSPQNGISGPLEWSVTEVLEAKVGLTSVTDFNFDGVTDASDLLVWYDHRFTAQGVPQRGDANNDGFVDASDLLLVYDSLFGGIPNAQQNQSLIEHGLPDASYIPEPSVLGVTIGAVALLRRKRFQPGGTP
jgi:hypothetical protein